MVRTRTVTSGRIDDPSGSAWRLSAMRSPSGNSSTAVELHSGQQKRKHTGAGPIPTRPLPPRAGRIPKNIARVGRTRRRGRNVCAPQTSRFDPGACGSAYVPGARRASPRIQNRSPHTPAAAPRRERFRPDHVRREVPPVARLAYAIPFRSTQKGGYST